MEFGITFPSYIEAWKDAQVAEDKGFTHAWFYDSQLLYSDVYATMALAAEHTRSLKLGTLVAIPSNRIAPVTASAIATINYLAPGRAILGVGTGFTGRNTMGLPALPAAAMTEYVQQVRGLLNGEDVLLREGDRERWIRLLHRDRADGFLNLDDEIPIYIAANGPKAQASVGIAGDGWITTTGPPEAFELGFGNIAAAAQNAGRSPGESGVKPYTVILGMGCVLQPGESRTSDRVVQRLGWAAMPGMHAAWEAQYGPGSNLGLNAPEVAAAYKTYIDDYADSKGSPEDRRYLDVHEGHLAYLKPGEEQFIDEAALSRTFLGSPEEIVERLKGLEAAGVDNLAIQTVQGSARELIDEFSEHVIAKM
jgi:alkanesulfonate monooxygenase SsuD/methylene tetrahydromethanopterin reductase-like flavin-dependent oxidoreductase (luciferase family)